MPWKSRWQVDIPTCSLPTFLLKSPTANLSKKPILIDATHPSYALSLASLRLWSQRLAAGLHQHGFAPQDRLLLCSGNSILFPVVLMGTIMAGGIFTGANPACVARELAYQIKDSGAKIVLAAAGSLNTVLEAAEQCGLGSQCVFVIDSGYETLEDKGQAVGTVRHWSELLVSPSLAVGFAWPELSHEEQRDTTAVLNYSSGTTGLAKGVQITHRNYIANCIQANYLSLLGENIEAKIARTRHLSVLPMYHAYGQTTFCVNAVALGTPVFIMQKYDFITMLTYIQKLRITTLALVPPILLAFTKRSETRQFDLSSVEVVKCSAAPLGTESKKEFERLWPPGKMNCKQGWGMTEVTSSACGLESDAIADDATVGELNPNLEAMIVDDNGREVQVGDRGDFWIRGPNVMKGYWNKPDQTAETISKDGWLMTGDIAYRNQEGRIYIVDRKKDLIKVKGNQVAPAELEALLLEHAAIQEVAVIGITRYGVELPRAYVVKRDDVRCSEEDIVKWLALRVTRHKRLTGGVRLLSNLPRNASGKLLRKVLCALAADENVERGEPESKL